MDQTDEHGLAADRDRATRLRDEAAARHMHAAFTRAVVEPRHLVTAVVETPADMVELIATRRATGIFHRSP